MKKFDCVVIGAGPSGMMAAITTGRAGKRVALLEKNSQLGKKLRLTGRGRCNVTNRKEFKDFLEHVPTNPKFLYSALSTFGPNEIIEFFETRNIVLKEEDHGRMFPSDDHSKTIVNGLVQACYDAGVSIFENTEAVRLLLGDDGNLLGVETSKGAFHASNVVIATGGKTYPSTGSTGDGFKLAKQVGHKVSNFLATESPLLSREPRILSKALQGLSLRDIELSVIDKKRKHIVTHRQDLLFTHMGLSGPAALRCSGFVNLELSKGEQTVTVLLDCLPDLSPTDVFAAIQAKTQSRQSIKNALKSLLPERLLALILEELKLEKPAFQLSKKDIEQMVQKVKALSFEITGTFPLEKSFVTKGGVLVKEINPKTMESKLLPGLFFTGEVLDVNAYTGGYNITIAFSTGFACGNTIAKK
jgi:predicted Rossmann fold flavoprotein